MKKITRVVEYSSTRGSRNRRCYRRAVSKRLVPTNVDMYRMYRNRDTLLRHHSVGAHPGTHETVDTQIDDQSIRRQLPGLHIRSVAFLNTSLK